ncbi:MAG: hypothetical protein Q6373_020860 [Candidatus Sigynarchaeota archaeon]
MSYIAKIYLKKMFRDDAFKIETYNGVEYLKITVNNVISPIEVKSLPDDSPNNHFDFIDENGKVIAGKGNPPVWEKFMVEAKGKKYDKDNYKSTIGVKVDRGEQYIVWVPNPGWKVGEEHKLTVKIYQDRPIEFFIRFTVT